MSSGLFAGRYSIERLLGHGATATVHLARDTQRGVAVAIKILRPELAQSKATDRFLKEIRRTSELQHPHILQVLDSGEHDGHSYFVLPYMEGGTLRTKIEGGKQLTFDETIAILRTIAGALDYAHTRGLIHRDVKPENILFTGGEACLGDFGIARALETVYGTDGSTSTDTIRGTYAYMSPEQAAGNKNLDGRSDIYSLACVTYEMITGMQAFIGPTPEAVVAQRFAYTPREVRVYRQSAPPAVDLALSKAFSMSPADRYKTTTEFVNALAFAFAGSHSSPSVKRRETPAGWPEEPEQRRVVGIGVVATLIALAAIVTVAVPIIRGPTVPSTPVDTTRLVILPLDRDDSNPPPWRDDDLLQQGMARWRDIALVDQFQVADALRRYGPVKTQADAASVAASLGAGRFIRGRVAGFGNEWRVSASLYDTRREQPLHQYGVAVPREIQAAASAYARLADSLLLRGIATDSLPSAQTGTRSLPAVQAFSNAQTALAEWDLTVADSALTSALEFDPQYARAAVWLAQVRAWRGRSRNAWGTVAERAAAMSDQLYDREHGLAQALIHLSKGSYSRACSVYEGLIKRNDRDFAAWFGLGECEMTNKLVVPDKRSPSGWRFTANPHRGMQAYRRALEILPSVYRGYQRGAFQRLRGLLLLSTQLVTGYGADSAVFQARPAWIGDSLVLVPYPDSVMAREGPVPPGMQTAIAKQRTEFRRVAATWSAAFPNSPGVKEAVAVSLELLGDVSAIDTLRRARTLSTVAVDRTRLGASEVLLLIKFGTQDRSDFLRLARTLGDSLLEAAARPGPEEARVLAPVAVFLGRCNRADSLINVGGSGVDLRGFSEALFAESQSLLVRGTLECSPRRDASLRQLATTIDRETTARRADSRLADGSLLMRPAIIITPYDTAVLHRLSNTASHPLVSAALAVGRHQSEPARLSLRQVEGNWALEPGTPDFVLVAAKARLAIGDTSVAVRSLDLMLNGVRAYGPEVLDDLGTAAAFVAGALLRADIALRQNDMITARRWSAVPAELWTRADAPLRTTASRMSVYASKR